MKLFYAMTYFAFLQLIITQYDVIAYWTTRGNNYFEGIYYDLTRYNDTCFSPIRYYKIRSTANRSLICAQIRLAILKCALVSFAIIICANEIRYNDNLFNYYLYKKSPRILYIHEYILNIVYIWQIEWRIQIELSIYTRTLKMSLFLLIDFSLNFH